MVAGDALVDVAYMDFYFSLYILFYGIPNLSVAALADDGRLIAVRAYTNCVIQSQLPSYVLAWPQTRFRIASVSKIITAIGALQLVDGQTWGAWSASFNAGLDTRVSDYFDFSNAVHGYPHDDRVYGMKLRHLLTHTSGWWEAGRDFTILDRTFPATDLANGTAANVYDADLADLFGECLPITTDLMFWSANSQSLTFDPGVVYSYCNHGWNVAARIIEEVSGMDAAIYLKAFVMDRVGAWDTERARTGERQVDEVYHFAEYLPEAGRPIEAVTDVEYNDSYLTSFLVGCPQAHPLAYQPYGGRTNLDIRLGADGWISTPTDLLLLIRELLPSRTAAGRLGIAESTIEEMFSTIRTASWQGLGWGKVFDRRGCVCWSKNGKDAGNFSQLTIYRRPIAESPWPEWPPAQPPAPGGYALLQNRTATLIEGAWDTLVAALNERQFELITDWDGGGGDLFDTYPRGGA